MTMSRLSRWLPAAALAAVVLVACGGGSDEPSPSAEGPATAAEPPATSTTAAPTSTTTTPATTNTSGSDHAPTTMAGSADEPVEEPSAPTTTVPVQNEEPTTTTLPPEPTTTVPVEVPEGPPVPSISLELDDGSVFQVADAVDPVLYVFWAEW